jgi:hypothetical protein
MVAWMFRPLHPQLQQFLTLLVLLISGKYVAYIHLTWVECAGLLLIGLAVDQFFVWMKHRENMYIAYSALSTTLGVTLMLVAVHFWMYAVVIGLALVQKHLIRVDARHFFNPSNFALIAAMLLFYNEAHLVLGQLGESFVLRMSVMVLAAAVLIRVDRWVIPLVFGVTYLWAEYVWIVGYDPVMMFEEIYERFYSVSFVVFVAFMLTDPRVTPPGFLQQVVFGAAVALIGVWMDRMSGFRVQHLFMALFVLSPWVPLFYVDASHRKKTLLVSLVLFLLAVGAIMYIENQPPYYFEMNGV